MKKRLALIVVALCAFTLSFAFTGCGSEPEVMTADKYAALSEAEWASMSPDEMTEFLGVEPVEDAESTAQWGEGYLVVNYMGVDENSKLHVLFGTNDDGSWRVCSMQPLGEVAD